jgi:FemAB-related protein (PEP-CTERM system-associated)
MAPSGTPHVAHIDDRGTEAWDRFAADHPQGGFFHRSPWRGIFDDIFRLKTHYLVAERDGAVTGILPLVQQNSILLGRGLISAPFCVEAGPLAADAASAQALDEAATALMEQSGASYVEYRSRKASRPGWQSKSGLYATFRRPISSDSEADLARIPRKQRAVVRKALQSALTIEIDRDPERFYPIYAASVHNLGTPVFGKNYFRALCERFGEACDIVVVLDRGEPVSAVLNFYHRDTVMPYYGGGLASARKSGANDLMYWAVMRHAAARGLTFFDFGRSKAGSGAFAFKKNWGFEPDWLEYEYWLAEGESLPDNNSASPKYRFFVESWKRMPLPLANRIGPLLIRHLN